MNATSVSDVILVGLVTKAIDRSKDVTPSQSNLFHFDTVFRTHLTKQESIPVGCVPTALQRVATRPNVDRMTDTRL